MLSGATVPSELPAEKDDDYDPLRFASGDPTPSLDDTRLTERISKAGEILGIKLLGHVIIGELGTYSFRKAGNILVDHVPQLFLCRDAIPKSLLSAHPQIKPRIFVHRSCVYPCPSTSCGDHECEFSNSFWRRGKKLIGGLLPVPIEVVRK